MRVSYRRQYAGDEGHVPGFLRGEFDSGTWERTGLDVDFPAIAKNPAVAAAVGYTGQNFLANAVDIRRWYNRATKAIAGSVIFSSGCEGPPGVVHGGAVSSALDDILGTMVWREAGFSRWGIPTMQLTIRFRGVTPMERQLRFDTHVVKREGRKVFVEAALRDPASGNKLLAEGEGLFYVRKPPTSPSATTAKGARRAPSVAHTGGPSVPPVANGVRGGPSRQPRFSQPPPSPLPSPPSEATSKTAAIARGTGASELLSYDEAIQKFGPGNPNAAANLVEFYGGDVNALLQRAKL